MQGARKGVANVTAFAQLQHKGASSLGEVPQRRAWLSSAGVGLRTNL